VRCPSARIVCRGAFNRFLLAAALAAAFVATADQLSAGPTLDHTTFHLSVARYDLAATTVGDKAIFAGGTEQGPYSAYSAVDIFNNTTGQWSTANLSVPRCRLAAATVGNLAIFAGGCLSFRDETFTSQVDIYNDATGTWSTAALSVPRGLLGGVAVGNRAYFAGGATTNFDGVPSGASNLIDVYDASTNVWSTMTMPHPRYDFTPLAIGGKIIFMGGGAPEVDIYNTLTSTWTTTALTGESSWPASRGGYAAAVVGRRAIFYGGTYADQYLNNIDIYDVDNHSWTPFTLPANSGYGAAAALGPFGLFAGGAYTNYQTDVRSFDYLTGVFADATPLSTWRASLAGASIGNHMIFAGGYNGAATSAVDIYTATPEPSSAGLLCFGFLLLRRHRRKHPWGVPLTA
jgi:hypothetical protein